MAAMNKSLIAVLGIVALIAGAFWTYQVSTAEKAPKVVWTPDEPMPLWCKACGKVTIVEPAVFATIPRDPGTGKYECPVCKEKRATVSYGPPARVAPETETKP